VASALRIKSIRVPIVFSAPEQFAAKLTLLDVLEPVPMPDRHMIVNDKRMPGEAHVELLTKQEAMNAKIVKKILHWRRAARFTKSSMMCARSRPI
jgi:hypothetical protein